MNILDLFFPKKCVNCKKLGNFLCANCFSLISYNNSYSCCVCLRPCVNGFTHPTCVKSFTLDAVIPVVAYKGVVKKLLYQFKYVPYLSSLNKTMSEIMFEGIIQNETLFSKIPTSILTCVPLHKTKLRKRGYNHAALLGKSIATLLERPFYPELLIRTKETKAQYKLKKEERIKNIKGAFSMSQNISIGLENSTIILIDDVATTYSTLRECALVLKKNGAKKVIAVTFAKET